MASEKKKSSGIRSAGGILDRIVEKRLERLNQAKQDIAINELIERGATGAVKHLSFQAAVSQTNRTNIIAEIKRRSPSKGIIREDFDHMKIAGMYAEGGAVAMSVLTEEDFFGGALKYLSEIHEKLPTPLLRKDFIIDEYQIYEACLAGASAILLITAILDDQLLAALIKRANELNLDALVEVHTEEEMLRAGDAGAVLIGVNNRDLTTFTVDLETSIHLAARAPRQAILVSESGITTGDDIRKLRSAGYQAFLIGEHLMRQTDVKKSLSQLIRESGNP